MTSIMIPSYLSLTNMHRARQISEISFLQSTLIYRSPSPLSAFRSNPPILLKCLPRNIKPRILHDGKNTIAYDKKIGLSPVFPKPLSVDLPQYNLVTVNFLSNNELTSWEVNLRAIIELEILFRKRNYPLEYELSEQKDTLISRTIINFPPLRVWTIQLSGS